MSRAEGAVLITGACGDIGRALAREFAQRGAALALCDLAGENGAAALLDELDGAGVKFLYQQVDVTNADAVGDFARGAASAFGGVATCIANAGIVERGALLDLSAERWRRQIDVNLTGSYLTARAAAHIMKEDGAGGRILFIGSWVQDVPREGIGAYCVSKSGLEMLARCMALELGRDGIRVNVVAPGFVDAGLTGENLRRHPEKRPGMEAEVPLGRLASAQEVARAALLLCSDDAAYITGTTLLVDGGASLHRKP